MKKLLSILGASTLIASSASAVVACSGPVGDQILFFMPNNNTAYNAVVEKQVYAELEKSGFDYTTVVVNEDTTQEYSLIKQKVDIGNIKGVITMPVNNVQSNDTYKYVHEKGIPIVAIDRTIDKKEYLSGDWSTDNTAGTRTSSKYWLDIMKGEEHVMQKDGVTPVESFKKFWTDFREGKKNRLNIVEFIGTVGASSSEQRHDGYAPLFVKEDLYNSENNPYPNNTIDAKDKGIFTYNKLMEWDGEFAKEILKEYNIPKNFEIRYASQPIAWEREQARKNMENIMSLQFDGQLPDVFLGQNDPGAQGVWDTIGPKMPTPDTNDHTISFGFDGFKSTANDFIQNNYITGTNVQRTDLMAKYAVERLKAIIEEGKKFKFGDPEFGTFIKPALGTNKNFKELNDEDIWMNDIDI